MKNKIGEPRGKRGAANHGIPIYGFGINDSKTITQVVCNGKKITCPYYSRWKAMLQRCYDPKQKERNPSYKQSLVTKEWLLFSNFKNWMMCQNHEGKRHLDKDLLKYGNKIYSPETCMFVPNQINLMMGEHTLGRGPYPIGVHLHKASGLFMSKYKENGKEISLGYFKDPKLAHSKYIQAKSSAIIRAANNLGPNEDPRLDPALRSLALMILQSLA